MRPFRYIFSAFLILLCGCERALRPGVELQATDEKALADLKEIGSLHLETDGLDLFYHRGLILIAAGVQGLVIVDVSDPDSPEEEARMTIQDMAISVAAEGTLAYVGGGPAGWPLAFLNVVDMADPRAPKIVGKLELPDYPAGLAVRDGIVYLADRSEGLRIINVSDSTSPIEIAAVTDIGYADDVVLSEQLALVLSAQDGTVTAISISSPEKPQVVGHLELGTECEELAVFAKTGYVSMGEAGLAVFDFSISSRLKRLQDVETPTAALAVLPSAERLVIADTDGLCLASGPNYSKIERSQNEEGVLSVGLAEGEDHLYVLEALAPAQIYGMFGEVRLRVLQFD